jgi:hypothetical protein
MAHNSTAAEAGRAADKNIWHGNLSTEGRAIMEVMGEKAKLTPTEYKKIFDVAKDLAIITVPSLAITYAAESLAKIFMTHDK